VEGLRCDDEVDARCREAGRFGGSGLGAKAPMSVELFLRCGAHRRIGLDSEDLVARGEKRPALIANLGVGQRRSGFRIARRQEQIEQIAVAGRCRGAASPGDHVIDRHEPGALELPSSPRHEREGGFAP